MWTNQATYCLRCESVGSGKDAQCDQCWMNLNDGWCHEPAGKGKEIHLLGLMSTLPGYWMSLANYSFIFWIFFCKGANFFFSNSAFFRFTISEPDYLTCLWLQSAVFLIMSVICDLYSVLRGMYEETLLEPDNRTWSTRESIRERMMCLDLTSFIHCALPVCLRSAL